MKSSTLTAITTVIAILGFIGGIVLGIKFENYYGEFNATLMIESWIGIALYCIPLAAISSSLGNQEMILRNQSAINENIAKTNKPVKDASNGKLNLAAVSAAQRNTSETWVCKYCGEVNKRDKRICQSCGRDK